MQIEFKFGFKRKLLYCNQSCWLIINSYFWAVCFSTMSIACMCPDVIVFHFGIMKYKECTSVRTCLVTFYVLCYRWIYLPCFKDKDKWFLRRFTAKVL